MASRSTPAKTVVSLEGKTSFSSESLTPGLAFAAAHPQTELTTTNVVPELFIALSISDDVVTVSYTHLTLPTKRIV